MKYYFDYSNLIGTNVEASYIESLVRHTNPDGDSELWQDGFEGRIYARCENFPLDDKELGIIWVQDAKLELLKKA